MTVVYAIAPSTEMDSIRRQQDVLEASIEAEENAVCLALTAEVARGKKTCVITATSWKLDFGPGKARHAVSAIVYGPGSFLSRLTIEKGRNLLVEEISAKKKDYCPVDVELYTGVTAITGNMGGKTIS